MDRLFRRAVAAFFLLAILANGWLELVSVAGACYLAELRRSASAEQAAPGGGCGGGACGVSTSRCSCCGDNCPGGESCRCGRGGSPARLPSGVYLTAAPCHPPPGSMMILANMPASGGFVFLAPVAGEIPPLAFDPGRAVLPGYTRRMTDHSRRPAAPPPRA